MTWGGDWGAFIRPEFNTPEKLAARLNEMFANVLGVPRNVRQTAPGTGASSSESPPLQGGQIVAAPETWGNIIPLTAGQRRVLGSYLWLNVRRDGMMNCAVCFGAPADQTATNAVTKIWADGGVIYEQSTSTKLAGMSDPVWYQGSESQTVDPDIAADYGAGRTPAYRGLMYVVLKNVNLTKFFNGRPPSIEAFIVDSGGVTWTIGEVIKAAGRLGGYTDAQMDVATDLTDPVGGPYLVDNSSAKDMWLAICRAYNIDMVDGGPAIVFTRCLDGEVYDVEGTVTDDELIQPPGSSAARFRRASLRDVPARIEVNYIDESQPWRFSTRPARRVLYPQKATSGNSAQAIKLQVLMSAMDAQTLASKALYRESEGRMTLEFSLPWSYLRIQPGDVLEVPFNEVTDTVKVVRADVDADLTLNIVARRLLVAEDYLLNAETGIVSEPVYTPPPAGTETVLDFVAGVYVVNGVQYDLIDLFEDSPLTDDGTFSEAHVIPGRGYAYWVNDDVAAGAIAKGPLLERLRQPSTVVIEWENVDGYYGGLMQFCASEAEADTGDYQSGVYFYATISSVQYQVGWDYQLGSGYESKRVAMSDTAYLGDEMDGGLNVLAFTYGTDDSNFSLNGATAKTPSVDTSAMDLASFPLIYPFGHWKGYMAQGYVRKMTVLDPVAASELAALSQNNAPRSIGAVSQTRTSTSVSFTFDAAPGATSYEYWLFSGYYGQLPTPFSDDTFQPLVGGTITGLTPSSFYTVIIRGVNASGPGGTHFPAPDENIGPYRLDVFTDP